MILRRLKNKKAPWKGGQEHIHHRLKKAGFSQKQTALIIYFVSISFGISALFLDTIGKVVAISFLLLLIICGEIYLNRKTRKMKNIV